VKREEYGDFESKNPKTYTELYRSIANLKWEDSAECLAENR